MFKFDISMLTSDMVVMFRNGNMGVVLNIEGYRQYIFEILPSSTIQNGTYHVVSTIPLNYYTEDCRNPANCEYDLNEVYILMRESNKNSKDICNEDTYNEVKDIDIFRDYENRKMQLVFSIEDTICDSCMHHKICKNIVKLRTVNVYFGDNPSNKLKQAKCDNYQSNK